MEFIILMFDYFLLAFVLLAFAPIVLMRWHGMKLPRTRGDRTDRKAVNRHLRLVDAQLRGRYGARGIFVTEAYSCIAHALMLSGVLPYVLFSSATATWHPDFTRGVQLVSGIAMLACVVFYGRVAWRRYKHASSR